MKTIEMEISLRYISGIFLNKSKIFIIGCREKDDFEEFRSHGYDVYGVDNDEEFVNNTHNDLPSLKPFLKHVVYPEIKHIFNFTFDGVLLGNVFPFLQRDESLQFVSEMKSILSSNGRLIVSLPLKTSPRTEFSSPGNTSNTYHPDQIQLLFERLGFQVISKWINYVPEDPSSSGWVTIAFSLFRSSTIRAADQIEGVLNADEKTATYKLALIRALSELAVNNFSQVQWLDDEHVAIPFEAIVEKWLLYYWPIVDSQDFIPQMEGERKDGSKFISFRKPLEALIAHYSRIGRFSVFVRDLHTSSFEGETKRLVDSARKAIQKAIVSGPVKYAGATQASGRLFGTEKGFLKCPYSLWREFSLLGHWIMDASIVRWAKETERIGKANLEGKVMDLLLTGPVGGRDVVYASDFYRNKRNLQCVWSGSLLKNGYDIDHIIPFVLWRNNDLWNLVPARRDVNKQKRDRLPSMRIMRKSKDAIVFCWESLQETFPNRFSVEASRLIGIPSLPNQNWENALFSALVESIELTALQRAIPRWDPIKLV